MLSTHEFADMAGVTPITVIAWCKKGKIKYKKTMGGHRRIPISEAKKINGSCEVETSITKEVVEEEENNKKTKYPINRYKKNGK